MARKSSTPAFALALRSGRLRLGFVMDSPPAQRLALQKALADLVHSRADGRLTMLFLVVLLLVLWFLGVITKYTLGGLLHILLVIAIVLGLVSFIGRRV